MPCIGTAPEENGVAIGRLFFRRAPRERDEFGGRTLDRQHENPGERIGQERYQDGHEHLESVQFHPDVLCIAERQAVLPHAACLGVGAESPAEHHEFPREEEERGADGDASGRAALAPDGLALLRGKADVLFLRDLVVDDGPGLESEIGIKFGELGRSGPGFRLRAGRRNAVDSRCDAEIEIGGRLRQGGRAGHGDCVDRDDGGEFDRDGLEQCENEVDEERLEAGDRRGRLRHIFLLLGERDLLLVGQFLLGEHAAVGTRLRRVHGDALALFVEFVGEEIEFRGGGPGRHGGFLHGARGRDLIGFDESGDVGFLKPEVFDAVHVLDIISRHNQTCFVKMKKSFENNKIAFSKAFVKQNS